MLRSTLLITPWLVLLAHCRVDDRDLETEPGADAIVVRNPAGGAGSDAPSPAGGAASADPQADPASSGAPGASAAAGAGRGAGGQRDGDGMSEESAAGAAPGDGAPQSLLSNPSFTLDVAPWTASVSAQLAWSNNDAAGNVASGSAQLTPSAEGAGGELPAARQCLEIEGGGVLEVSAMAYVAPDASDGRAALNLSFFSNASCSTPPIATSPGTATSQVGRWVKLSESRAVPVSARSMRVDLALSGASDSNFDLRFDNVLVQLHGERL